MAGPATGDAGDFACGPRVNRFRDQCGMSAIVCGCHLQPEVHEIENRLEPDHSFDGTLADPEADCSVFAYCDVRRSILQIIVFATVRATALTRMLEFAMTKMCGTARDAPRGEASSQDRAPRCSPVLRDFGRPRYPFSLLRTDSAGAGLRSLSSEGR